MFNKLGVDRQDTVAIRPVLIKLGCGAGGHKRGTVNLGASFDWQKPKDDITGKLLARRAQRTLKLNADTRVTLGSMDWAFGAEWLAGSRRLNERRTPNADC